jgi:hypothetical protein
VCNADIFFTAPYADWISRKEPIMLRGRQKTTWLFMMHYLTAPYAIRLTKTARLFSDNGLLQKEKYK